MNLKKSETYLTRASQVIPGASQTLSKGPTQWTQLPVIVKGDGCHVWDMDGNQYIDLPGALGPVILGYNHPAVNEAIRRQLDTGIIVSSTPNLLEAEVAEMLVDLIPCAEMVRFGKNGSDVTSAAVRLARAVTKRYYGISIGYHGWQDWSIGAHDTYGAFAYGEKAAGIHYDEISTIQVPFNDYRVLEDYINTWASIAQPAYIILEPITAEEPNPGYLQAVRDLCTKHGTVLIFDEVKTGFRVSLGGAQELYGVTPDLACFGKAMGNGMPISALVGKRELMEHFDRVFFSTTFGGECLSLAAAKATMGELQKTHALLEIKAAGSFLGRVVNGFLHYGALPSYMRCTGHASKKVVQCSYLDLKTLIQQEMIKQGVLWNGEHMLSLSFDTKDIAAIIDAYNYATQLTARAIQAGTVEQQIEGRMLTEVFRR